MGGIAASADVFRAVADPARRALLELMCGSERSVSRRLPLIRNVKGKCCPFANASTCDSSF